jgi:hypothetical protein
VKHNDVISDQTGRNICAGFETGIENFILTTVAEDGGAA